jgi:NAD(P)-dependent dehydrogenase (short-subunit alcohol dehydrogenase family)
MESGPKNVLVTGAAKRLGRAIALELGRHGWSVAVHYANSQREAEETAAVLLGMEVDAVTLKADLAIENETSLLVSQARAALGPITALVNNASLFEYDNLQSMTRASWDSHMAINLRAPVVLVQEFAKQLEDGTHGAVVNLLDQRVFKPTPEFFSYSVTRAGLHWMTKTMAQALAPRIRVNAVAPGPTLPNARQSQEHFERQRASTILGHGATPEEVADAVRYLIDAPSVTGQTIAVDGGQHLIWRSADAVEAEE